VQKVAHSRDSHLEVGITWDSQNRPVYQNRQNVMASLVSFGRFCYSGYFRSETCRWLCATFSTNSETGGRGMTSTPCICPGLSHNEQKVKNPSRTKLSTNSETGEEERRV